MYLGIDLGTSNSAIFGNDGAELKLFKTSDGYDVLPSAIMIDRRGAMFVGKRAYEQDAFSPGSVNKQFKRLMGTTSTLTFKDANITMTPEQASTEILKTLLSQMRMALGDTPVQGAIITTPAAFNQLQCEATMRAGQDAGIQNIGLLQEPIAAAMASIAGRSRKNVSLKDGQFIVYDLGGGTFDVAIVQSVGGTVNIIGHDGVNMLGGSDFDRTIVDAIVRPWLLDTFDLPKDLQKYPAYERVLRIARVFAEKAKIELSLQQSSSIFADENQLRTRDESGKDMYIDISIDRLRVDGLISDQINRSIEVCRKLISENGYQSSDIDRVVFIGGPTRMPIIRDRVPYELGIAGDLDSDPMTAVAMGAAIYAESRDWAGGASTAKSSRAIAKPRGPLNIEYGYPTRTSDNRIRIRLRPANDLLGQGLRLQLDSDAGWTSGQLPLNANAINDVPLTRRGDNHFRITIFDAAGYPIKEGETRFTVRRTDATAGGTPLTHTIAVKVLESESGVEKNTLDVLVEKGGALPAKGMKPYRAAHDLKATDSDKFIEFEVYQMDDVAVADPKLNLHIGAFRIEASDLDRGETIRRGIPIKVYWFLDENGLLNCELEVESLGRRFSTGKMFTDQGARKNFDGEEGDQLAGSMLDMAEREVEELEKTLGSRASSEALQLKSEIDAQRQRLSSTNEPEVRRSAADEGRTIRQRISKIKNRPDNISDVLQMELKELKALYDEAVRPTAVASTSDRFDRLSEQAKEFISQGNAAEAKKSISEMRATLFEEVRKQPAFVVNMFLDIARERQFAINKDLHDQLIETGKKCIDREDVDGLRSVVGQMLENRYQAAPVGSAAATLAGLMRA